MVNAAGSAVGGIFNALQSQNGVDRGDRAASSQGGGGLRVCHLLGREAFALGSGRAIGALHGRGFDSAGGIDFQNTAPFSGSHELLALRLISS